MRNISPDQVEASDSNKTLRYARTVHTRYALWMFSEHDLLVLARHLMESGTADCRCPKPAGVPWYNRPGARTCIERAAKLLQMEQRRRLEAYGQDTTYTDLDEDDDWHIVRVLQQVLRPTGKLALAILIEGVDVLAFCQRHHLWYKGVVSKFPEGIQFLRRAAETVLPEEVDPLGEVLGAIQRLRSRYA